MTDYNEISNEDIDPDSNLNIWLLQRLRQNPLAASEGKPGAYRWLTDSFINDSIEESKIVQQTLDKEILGAGVLMNNIDGAVDILKSYNVLSVTNDSVFFYQLDYWAPLVSANYTPGLCSDDITFGGERTGFMMIVTSKTADRINYEMRVRYPNNDDILAGYPDNISVVIPRGLV